MEKKLEFRIVGSAPQEGKDEKSTLINRYLFDHLNTLSSEEPELAEAFKKFEYSKTDTELGLISFANEETSRLLKEIGVEPYDVESANYHILPPELYQKLAKRESSGETFYTKQLVILNAANVRRNPIGFGSTALHETLHIKGHIAFEAEPGTEKTDKPVITQSRAGVSIASSQKETSHGKFHRHFRGLNEAIVASQEFKSFKRMLELPILQEEKQRMESKESLELKEKIAAKYGFPKEDIIWVGQKEDEHEEFGYGEHVRFLSYICTEIKKQFPEQFSSAEDVFIKFLRAHVTGELITIAKLVDQTFGEGKFRELGNMTIDKDSAVLHSETFRKARMRLLKRWVTNSR